MSVQIRIRQVLLFFICLLFASFLPTIIAHAKPAATASKFELVESVPKDTIYGQPGVRRTQTVWLEMINHAKKSIEIGAFYIQDSKYRSALTPVLEALKKAADRDVKVRILIDSQLLSDSLPSLNFLRQNKKIDIRILPMQKITGGIMHAKYMIVDGENVFVGSQNFDSKALEHIHEIGVHVQNKKLAATIQQVFNLDWQLAEKPLQSADVSSFIIHAWQKALPINVERPLLIKDKKETLVIHPAFSPLSLLPDGLDWEQTQFIHLIHQAKYEIVMQVLQYSPGNNYHRPDAYWPALDNALREAAARGVKIKLIVSNWNLKPSEIDYIKSLAVLHNVEVKYSVVPPYKNQFISFARVEHCKYFVVDNDLSFVGTGNWQWGYFHNTRDISIIINGKGPAKQLREIFYRDWNGPYVHPIDPDKTYQAPKVV